MAIGRKAEGPLLGAVTLATMGFMLNPLTREIQSMRLMLLRAS